MTINSIFFLLKRISITYHSKTGITRKFAEGISSYLESKGCNVNLSSIQEFDKTIIANSDVVLLGCWTSGLMVFLQHPDKEWKNFARSLTGIEGKKVVLFTTYKLLTGSMFQKMKSHLPKELNGSVLELKSRNGQLSEEVKLTLNSIVNLS